MALSPAQLALAQALTAPRAVALVGASTDPSKTGGRAQRYLARHGFSGTVYPINPNAPEVQGVRAYKDLRDVPGPVDHAYILLNAPHVLAAIEACAAARVPVATILAGGFADAGDAGRALQARIQETARAGGVRLIGPNSMGVIDVATRTALTVNAALELERLLPGRLTVLSQSGSLLGTLLSRGQARGIGFRRLVSVGNEADLSIGELGQLFVDDPDTDAFLLFLETIRGRDALATFANQAHAAGKPLIAFALGRSEAGQKLATSHTGALAGSRAAMAAFLREHGIIEVDLLETLFEMPPLAIGRKPFARRAPTASVATTTGGGGAMVVDRLESLGVSVLAPSPAASARAAERKIALGDSPLIDLTLAGTRPDTVDAVIETLVDHAGTDAVVMVVGSSAQFHPQLAVKPLVRFARAKTPVAVFLVPQADASMALLAEAGIAAFRTPEACADALRALLTWQPPRPAAIARPAGLDAAAALLRQASGRTLDERASAALFAALGVPCVASTVLAPTTVDSQPLAVTFPAVAKILSPDLPHKTEVGGVALRLADDAAVRDAARNMLERIGRSHPAARIAGVLVQPMEQGLAEALIGYRLDPQVGPIVTLAAGGTLAEIYRDSAVRLAPTDAANARAMIDEVKGLAPIRGYRGMPEGDLDALAAAVVALSQLAHLAERPVAEAEINPVLVRGKSK
ncbi:MAG: acetate--CoA ligase family protein, partial [Alphaproteobacteria bacterium]|nr:acetate--CoA ligase family protein [Alphaproteobacteria bacterium]